MTFVDATIGASLLMPPVDWLEQIEALKTFKLKMEGPDELTYWFAQTFMKTQNSHWDFGVDMPDGTKRYVNHRHS